ncbi:MAG: hypothetical protein CME62_10985 [Halobacteriovoraceae bacterium]|nr:hypothetical protein [Halobacteriovoraceae bacterium]
MNYLNTKLKNILLSVVLIPLSATDNFMELSYSKIKPNGVKLDKTVEIKVSNSASPLFYRLDKPRVVKSVTLAGEVEIEKKISDFENDAYFQLGVVYEGDYYPNWIIKKVLPDWLVAVLSLSDDTGVSEVHFLGVLPKDEKLKKSDSIRDITLNFNKIADLENKSFQFSEKLKDKKVLGFWLRADGDESDGKFTTTLNSFKISY